MGSHRRRVVPIRGEPKWFWRYVERYNRRSRLAVRRARLRRLRVEKDERREAAGMVAQVSAALDELVGQVEAAHKATDRSEQVFKSGGHKMPPG